MSGESDVLTHRVGVFPPGAVQATQKQAAWYTPPSEIPFNLVQLGADLPIKSTG
jgi:hypothetical protein